MQDVVQYARERGIQVITNMSQTTLHNSHMSWQPYAPTWSHIRDTYHIFPQVIPELDAPAHVGAGWEAVDPEMTTCVYKEPWTDW